MTAHKPVDTYFSRLKSHPGIPTAMILTVCFMFAALANEHSFKSGLILAAVFSAWAWAIVLWTARR